MSQSSKPQYSPSPSCLRQAPVPDRLETYRSMRDPDRTAEPVPADPASHTDLVYHHGAARRLATLGVIAMPVALASELLVVWFKLAGSPITGGLAAGTQIATTNAFLLKAEIEKESAE